MIIVQIEALGRPVLRTLTMIFAAASERKTDETTFINLFKL